MQHPAEREAERLRTIITALAAAMPDMELSVAKDVIFESEKKAAELERQQVEQSHLFMLPDTKPQTIAAAIALQPDIAELVADKKINAIKETRARFGANGTYLGLKEAKEGVEHYGQYGAGPGPVPAPSHGSCASNAPGDIALWIEVYGTSTKEEYDAGKHINAIKEVRARCPSHPSLYDAKKGYEEWRRVYR